jgi:hypothetical protein
VFSHIVEGDKENWKITGWEKQARNILTAAYKSENEGAKQRAEDLIHRLGARGYLRFRDLVDLKAP